MGVAPLVGAWIEIFVLINLLCLYLVAPLVGAWIEISLKVSGNSIVKVAPLVGAWIEIKAEANILNKYMSLLL